MDLETKKNVFVTLGRFLNQFAENNSNQDLSVPNNDLFFEEFEQLIQLSQSHNGWYTPEQVYFSIQSWAKALTKENLDQWTSSYDFTIAESKTIALILAGNIPLVGFHDFISVLISGHNVLVKTSSNDQHLLPFLAKYLITLEPQLAQKITFVEGKLENFDAIVLGIRAYNTNERAKFYQKHLHSYVENGGTLIVQYNTRHRVKVDEVAPYPLKLSRDRVTDENSEVRIINPNHEILNYPNKISETDFNGWVQERGLYFPNEWDSNFEAILSMNDKNETPKSGSLLVAKYGQGNFIYTGLSFFRELPAGVSGAYKLFANMLSIGKNNIEKPIKN